MKTPSARQLKTSVKRCYIQTDSVLGYQLRKLRYGRLPIQPNKIAFMTFQGEYTCNPKYICETLRSLNAGLDLVWIVPGAVAAQPQLHGFPSDVRTVAIGSPAHFREAATARIWVDNALSFQWRMTEKRPGQLYFNTWHGSLGIKRLDTAGTHDAYWERVAALSNRTIDAFFTNSTFEDDVLHGAHWPDVATLRLGHARNDVLFDADERRRHAAKVRSTFSLPADVHLALYAPTFHEQDATQPSLNAQKTLAALEHRFGGRWALLERRHFQERSEAYGTPANASILDASAYPDMQELIAAADVGITDYSSWIFDFLFTGRPGFIYAPDAARYAEGRGLYYPLEQAPFALAHDNHELVEAVARYDEAEHRAAVARFLQKQGSMEDGRACARIADFLLYCLLQTYDNTGNEPIGFARLANRYRSDRPDAIRTQTRCS